MRVRSHIPPRKWWQHWSSSDEILLRERLNEGSKGKDSGHGSREVPGRKTTGERNGQLAWSARWKQTHWIQRKPTDSKMVRKDTGSIWTAINKGWDELPWSQLWGWRNRKSKRAKLKVLHWTINASVARWKTLRSQRHSLYFLKEKINIFFL